MRVGLNIFILSIAGALLGKFASENNVVAFTMVLFIATILVALVSYALGPVQKADEGAIKRSEEAALFSIRIATILGLFGVAYGQLLKAPIEIVALSAGMVVPGVFWVLAYLILNVRDLY